METKSQNQKILKFLLNGGTLTPMQALRKFNCWALSSRISNIRDMGYLVKSELVEKNGKRFSKVLNRGAKLQDCRLAN